MPLAKKATKPQGLGGRETAGCVLGLGGLAAAALVVAWQAYIWLKSGHWPNVTMTATIAPLISGTDFSSWLGAPQSWYGLSQRGEVSP